MRDAWFWICHDPGLLALLAGVLFVGCWLLRVAVRCEREERREEASR